jgi:outer membrane protein OmpA-like peptidoglycan-associated protein
MTNMDYARQRTKIVLAYLEARGVKTDSIKINIKGETSRFSDNKNVTMIWEEIKNLSEQNSRREERNKRGTN